jgi:hypothetical protein
MMRGFLALAVAMSLLVVGCDDSDTGQDLSGHSDLLVMNNTDSEVQLTYWWTEYVPGFPVPRTISVAAHSQTTISVWYESNGESEITATQEGREKQYRVWHEQSALSIDTEDFGTT